MRQWQCTCGEWVDMTRHKHIHVVESHQPTLDEILAARYAGRDAEALQPVSDVTAVYWSPDFPRRERPDE